MQARATHTSEPVHARRDARLCLQHRALRNYAGFQIPPQGDKEFPCQRHDSDAPDPGVPRSKACSIPDCKRTLRLIPEPAPRKLHRKGAEKTVPSLADSSLTPYVSTASECAAQSSSSTNLPAISELPPGKKLGGINPRAHLTHGAKCHKLPHHRKCGIIRIVCIEQGAALIDEHLDLTSHQSEPAPFPRAPRVCRTGNRNIVPHSELSLKRHDSR